MIIISNILAEWLNERTFDLVENYNRIGARASGNWPKSLEQVVTDNGTTINGKLVGAQYTGVMITGRRPTSPYGPYQDGPRLFTIIEKWIKDKGLPIWDGYTKKSMAYVIARKIHREGIKAPNPYYSGQLLDGVFSEENYNDLKNKLAGSYIKNIKEIWQLPK